MRHALTSSMLKPGEIAPGDGRKVSVSAGLVAWYLCRRECDNGSRAEFHLNQPTVHLA